MKRKRLRDGWIPVPILHFTFFFFALFPRVQPWFDSYRSFSNIFFCLSRFILWNKRNFYLNFFIIHFFSLGFTFISYIYSLEWKFVTGSNLLLRFFQEDHFSITFYFLELLLLMKGKLLKRRENLWKSQRNNLRRRRNLCYPNTYDQWLSLFN